MQWLKVTAGIFAADTGIKYAAERFLEDHKTKELAGGRILLRKVHNYGAAGGVGKKDPDMVKKGAAGIYAGLLAGQLVHVLRKEHPLKIFGGALLLGGGASNLFDRIRKGYVTDYVSFGLPWKWLEDLVFNVSDFMIFIGTLLIGLGGELDAHRKKRDARIAAKEKTVLEAMKR